MTEHATTATASTTTDLFEIMRTTRSMRRLKPEPVPNALIHKILEAAVCAPSGGNMQRWRFLVIKDAAIKKAVGAYYKRAWDEQVGRRYRAGEPAPGMDRDRFLRLLDAAEYLAAHIHEAPVWIVPCLEGSTPTRTSGSSIYPAVPEHAPGGTSARPGGDVDDALFGVREGSRGRTRLAGGLAFLCHSADRLSVGLLRAGSSNCSQRCRLSRPVGSDLP